MIGRQTRLMTTGSRALGYLAPTPNMDLSPFSWIHIISAEPSPSIMRVSNAMTWRNGLNAFPIYGQSTSDQTTARLRLSQIRIWAVLVENGRQITWCIRARMRKQVFNSTNGFLVSLIRKYMVMLWFSSWNQMYLMSHGVQNIFTCPMISFKMRGQDTVQSKYCECSWRSKSNIWYALIWTLTYCEDLTQQSHIFWPCEAVRRRFRFQVREEACDISQHRPKLSSGRLHRDGRVWRQGCSIALESYITIEALKAVKLGESSGGDDWDADWIWELVQGLELDWLHKLTYACYKKAVQDCISDLEKPKQLQRGATKLHSLSSAVTRQLQIWIVNFRFKECTR